MPANFEKCVKEKGKVIRIKPNGKTYLNICYDKNNKAHSGEVHHMEADAIKEVELILEAAGKEGKKCTCKDKKQCKCGGPTGMAAMMEETKPPYERKICRGCGNVMDCRCIGERVEVYVDTCPNCETVKEESSTAGTAANVTSEMGKMMRKAMPKGEKMTPTAKAKMKKKMKKANKSGKTVCAEGK